MSICAGVKIGTKKQLCDDTVIINTDIINDTFFKSDTDFIKIIGVADGVGGNFGGKEASSFVAKQLATMDFSDEIGNLREQFIQLNDRLIEYAFSTQDQKQMATTLTVLIRTNDKCFLAHIGNTRMYIGQGSYLKQFTSDHTTYQWLLSHGQVESAELCNKNEISACMGGGNNNLVQQIEVRQVFDDGMPNCVLFTSDGVHEYVDIDRLEELIFSGKSDEEIIKATIEEAESNGSDDDKTVIILRKKAI